MDYLRDKYGEEMLETGGLRVTTTLDWDLQQVAEKVVEEGAKRNMELYKGRNAALVAEEAKTGAIVSLVGSYDYFDIENEGNFNVATQGLRQPGSSFKPIVYVTAFGKGYLPDTKVFDLPTEFSTKCPASVDFSVTDTDCYHPKNFDNTFRGPVSLRQALGWSLNVPAVKVLYLIGLDEALDAAKKLGISTLGDKSRFGLSLVLGGGEVRLTELVHAYSAFAGEGVQHKQNFILKVEDSEGTVLEEFKDNFEEVLNPQPVRLLNSVLSDTETRRGLLTASLPLTVFPGYDVALKTGTTNDYVDAWTVGYTPSLVVGVWAGNNYREPMQKNAGSVLAALPMWNNYFKEAIKKYPEESFTPPEAESRQKPVLMGNYAPTGEAHSILYYVDKDDPLGPAPYNPASDPQFSLWEPPVLSWAQDKGGVFDVPTITTPTEPATGSSSNFSPITINIKSPVEGEFVNTPEAVRVRAVIKAGEEITRVEISVDNKRVAVYEGEFSKNYELSEVIRGVRWRLKSTLTIKVVTARGNEAVQSVKVTTK